MVIIGCQTGSGGLTKTPTPSTKATPPNHVGTTNPSEFVTRTTTQDEMTLTIKVARETILNAPVPVTVEFSNHGKDPVYITYSRPIRLVRPVVWFYTMSGKAELTAKGRRDLSHWEEMSNRTGEVLPGKTWRLEFDLRDYYQIDVPTRYLLGASFWPEKVDANSGDRVRVRFDLNGIEFRVRKPG
jgi:hypothetical protein